MAVIAPMRFKAVSVMDKSHYSELSLTTHCTHTLYQALAKQRRERDRPRGGRKGGGDRKSSHYE